MSTKPKRNGAITVAGTQKEARALATRSIAETMVGFETVRRFISMGLNQALRRAETEAKKKNQQLAESQRKKLEIDYGTIPGVNKPFLLQPGAEKIARWLKVRPVYETVDTELGNGHLEVVSRCRLLDRATQEEVFQGPRCSCSSMEPNFRFRWVMADPQPSKDWIFSEGRVRKAEGTGKSVKEWKNGKPTGQWLWQDRVENKDIHGERNKVRQMGEKRAIVKAIRNYGALSEIFTEDPSEWAFPDDEEGIEAEEQPTGKIVRDTPSEKGEASQNVAPGGAPTASASPAKIITVTWGSDAAEVAYVSGDIAQVVEQLKGSWQGIQLEGREVYVLPATFVAELEKWCMDNGYQLQEISGSTAPASLQPPPTAAPATKPEAATPSHQTKGPEVQGTSGPAAAEIVTVQGVVKHVRINRPKAKGAQNAAVECYNVLIGEPGSGAGVFYYAYNRNLWPILDQALNKPVTVLVKQKAIVGFVRVNGREFDADGITPVIQNSEERPKEGSLFK